jgi:hypothetical protein
LNITRPTVSCDRVWMSWAQPSLTLRRALRSIGAMSSASAQMSFWILIRGAAAPRLASRRATLAWVIGLPPQTL